MGDTDDHGGPTTARAADSVEKQLATGRTSDDGTGLTVVRDTGTPPPARPPTAPERRPSPSWTAFTTSGRDLGSRLVGFAMSRPRSLLVVVAAVAAVIVAGTAVVLTTDVRTVPSRETDSGPGNVNPPKVAPTPDDSAALTAAAARAAAKADELSAGDPIDVLRLRLVAATLDPERHRLALSELLLRTDGTEPTVAADTVLPASVPITTATLSPDGETLFTTASDTTTQLWDLNDPTKVRSRGALPAGVVTYAADNKAATLIGAMPGSQPTASLWGANRLASPQHLATLSNGAVDVLAISPDGLLAVTAAGTAATMWSVGIRVSPRVVASFAAAEPITAAAFTPNGKTLLFGDATGHVTTVSMTDSGRPSTLRTMSGHTGRVTHIAISGDGTSVVSVDDHGGVAAWTMTSSKDLTATALTVRPFGQDAMGAPLPAGLVLVSTVDNPGSVWSWTGSDEPQQWFSLPFAHSAPLPSLLSSRGSRAVTVGRDGHITIWDLAPIVAILSDPARRACELIGGQITEQQWSDAAGTIAYRDVC